MSLAMRLLGPCKIISLSVFRFSVLSFKENYHRKRKTALLYCILITVCSTIWTIKLLAETVVPGGIVSGTWNLASSPYKIMGSIQISDGETLTIDPGVRVEFQGAYKLNVQGRLLAIGMPNDTITFTAADINSGWRGIRFDNTAITNDTSEIKYCKLQYCNNVIGSQPDNLGGALYFYNFSKAIISKSYIANCSAVIG